MSGATRGEWYSPSKVHIRMRAACCDGATLMNVLKVAEPSGSCFGFASSFLQVMCQVILPTKVRVFFPCFSTCASVQRDGAKHR